MSIKPIFCNDPPIVCSSLNNGLAYLINNGRSLLMADTSEKVFKLGFISIVFGGVIAWAAMKKETKQSHSFFQKVVAASPLLMPIGGLATTLGIRLAHGIPAGAKVVCREMTDQIVWKGLNKLKQNEIQYALALSTLLFAFNVYQDVQSQYVKEAPHFYGTNCDPVAVFNDRAEYNRITSMPHTSLCQKIGQAVKRQFTLKECVFFGVSAALSFGHSVYSEKLFLTPPKFRVPETCPASDFIEPIKPKLPTTPATTAFDASGHVMLKLALAPLLVNLLSKTSSTHPRLAKTIATGYAITDAVFLANTAYLCHKAYEATAGMFWAGTIASIAGVTARLVT